MSELDEQLKADGFSVVDEVVMPDLTDLKEEKILVPPTKAVKFLIKSASANDKNKDGSLRTWRTLRLELRIVDGIAVNTAEGEKTKFKNKPIFVDVCYYADKEGKNKEGILYADCEWYQKRKYLLEYKNLAVALGYDPAKLKVNDEFIRELSGKYVVGDIKHTMNKWTKQDGTKVEEPKEDVVRYRKAELI